MEPSEVIEIDVVVLLEIEHLAAGIVRACIRAGHAIGKVSEVGQVYDAIVKQLKDINLAKHTIDTIAMLKDRTEGNLNEEEKKFLEAILTDLRWRYVKAVG